MKLMGSLTSPFVRKIRVILIEKGLKESDIEFINTMPWNDPEELIAVNPLSRVPVIILNGGVTFHDSRLITHYIENNLQGPKFVPENGTAKWFVLQAEALADGLIEICIRVFLEQARPPEKQIGEKIERDEQTIQRTIAVMAKMIGGFETPINLGSLSFACALAYVDLRVPQLNWRELNPELSGWFQNMRLRPSMQQTRPPENPA